MRRSLPRPRPPKSSRVVLRRALPFAGAALLIVACSTGAAEPDDARVAEILAEVSAARRDADGVRTPPPFVVASRIAHLEEVDWFPCSDCHEDQEPNPNVRRLRREHDDIHPDHGGGRFWCMACHHPEDKDHLVALDGSKVSFDVSYRVCGGCHFEQERDFLFGVHGRRVGNWLGDRTYLTCVECHDPHQPRMEPRAPHPPPRIRPGLAYETPAPHGEPKPWVSVVKNRVARYGTEFMDTTPAPDDGGEAKAP